MVQHKQHIARQRQRSQADFPDSVARLAISNRWPLLLLAVALGVGGYLLSRGLVYDHSIERMFVTDDPVLEPYNTLKEFLGGNEIVLGVYEDPDLLKSDGSGLKKLESVAAQLRAVEGVQDVLSLAEINRALVSLYSASRLASGLPQVNLENLLSSGDRPPEEKSADNPEFPLVNPVDQLAQEFLDIFRGYTHSDDGKIVAVVCMLHPQTQRSIPRQKTISGLRKILDGFRGGRVTGEPVMVVDGFRFLQADGRRLGTNAMVLVGLVIVACFRSLRWVAIPLAVVFFTLFVTRGVLAACGLQLTMVSSMFTSVVVVIAVATLVHVIVRYREIRDEGIPNVDALQATLAALMWPICWSCLTDAAGFGSLMVSRVAPVRDFGLMMAIASLVVPLGTLLLVPGLALFGSFDSDPQKTWGESQLRFALNRPTQWLQFKPQWWLAGLALLTVLAVVGVFFLRIETDFTKNFSRDSEIAQSTEFVETRFSGAGVMDLLIPVEGRLTKEFLERVEALQTDLAGVRYRDGDQAGEFALSRVISIADADRAACRVTAISLVPFTLRFQTMRTVMPVFFDALYSTESDRPQQGLYRIMMRTSQRQTDEQKRYLLDEIDRLAQRHFPPTAGTEAEITGYFVLLSQLVSSVLRDQNLAIVIATIAIGLMMWFALQNWRVALIALVPNLLPIVVVLGTLGWIGVPINMGSAMISAVSVGLSIDSSIHYLWTFRRARSGGAGLLASIQSAQLRAGRAMVFSTLALVIGFSSLYFSDFIPTVYFGVLASLTMVGGLLGNLFILPLLLTMFGRRAYQVKRRPRGKKHA